MIIRKIWITNIFHKKNEITQNKSMMKYTLKKRDAIDKWKEEHGQYDEERTKERIGGKKIEEDNEIEEDEEEDYSM